MRIVPTKPLACTRAWRGMPGCRRRDARVNGGRGGMRRVCSTLLTLRARAGVMGVGVLLSALVASPVDAQSTTRRLHLAHLRRQLSAFHGPHTAGRRARCRRASIRRR
jgi:hypothetical protein